MKYFSLNDKKHISNFEDAVLKGLAPERGLYFPQEIKKLPDSFFDNLKSMTKFDIAFEVIKEYVGEEIPEQELKKIIETTLDFNFPMVKLTDDMSILELFHGPTLAFKDVGARFMAGCLGYFIKKHDLGKITVLVATSGDTGGAVANGFWGVEGIEVVILYPKGKVSEIQEKQLTTLGKNITALEVDGVFDDCQEMVKQAFQDNEIQQKKRLTSANSINIARWLPQMFYYFLAYQQLMEEGRKLVFSVPSGNFGNICAGFLARKMGLPIDQFIASNNVNNVVERYLKTEKFEPSSSIQTLSNAMDVGNPSNFVRILQLFQHQFGDLEKSLSAYSFSDDQTKAAIKEVYDKYNYAMDPHGAVGYLGLKMFLKENNGFHGTFLETAHPVKFLETVEAAIQQKVEIPESIQRAMDKEKKSLDIKDYEELKEFLMR